MFNIVLELLLLCSITIAVDEKSQINTTISSVNNNINNNTDVPDTLMSNKTLYIKVIPGYPGVRSDLYEVYMEPYNFAIGTKASVDLKTYAENGIPVTEGPTGVLLLEQYRNGILITGYLSALYPGVYELAVHQKGQLTKGCLSSGELYNPFTMYEAANETIDPTADPLYRINKLIDNITVENDGSVQIKEMTNHHFFTLTSRANAGIIGRTIIMQQKNKTKKMQLSCGIVGFA